MYVHANMYTKKSTETCVCMNLEEYIEPAIKLAAAQTSVAFTLKPQYSSKASRFSGRFSGVQLRDLKEAPSSLYLAHRFEVRPLFWALTLVFLVHVGLKVWALILRWYTMGM